VASVTGMTARAGDASFIKSQSSRICRRKAEPRLPEVKRMMGRFYDERVGGQSACVCAAGDDADLREGVSVSR